MSNTVIAGKLSNTIGEKDSPLVLRGRSIKILWGNKFIDLIKNGKINVDADKILKTADSVEGITSDGIYLVGESVWTVIGGTKIQIAGDSATTYVSYLVALETTPELKKQALTNIGFYYDTYEQAQNAGLTTGIVYVLGDNKLYVVKDGILTEYITTSTSTSNEETPMGKLYISEYSLMVDGEEYITCDGDINIHKKFVLEEGLMSSGATSSFGYRLYTLYGESYLEVDNLIVRNSSSDKTTIYPIKYYQEENVILSVLDSEDHVLLQLTLLYSDKYKVGDILTTSVWIDTENINEQGETISEQILVPIDFKIISIIDNKTYVVSTEYKDISNSIISLLTNKSIFYKKGLLPIARIKDNNYDLFKPNVEQSIENINTRIGSLSELTVDVLGKIENNALGIYSDNAILEAPKLIESLQYGATFNPINNSTAINNYPKYSNSLKIPEDVDSDVYDSAIPSINWIKLLLDTIIPKGTIVMWNGTNIPENWAICDGNNGTPNLIGKFIKASKTPNQTGGSNKTKLNTNNLPDHTHSISALNSLGSGEHNHIISSYDVTTSEAGLHNHTVTASITTGAAGSNTHTHSITTNNITSSSETVNNINTKTTTVNLNGTVIPGTGAKITTLSKGDLYLDVSNTSVSHTIPVSNIKLSSANEENHTHSVEIKATSENAGAHQHTFSVPDKTTSTKESHIHNIPAHSTSGVNGANNAEFSIEPEYYSLIFIMKIK